MVERFKRLALAACKVMGEVTATELLEKVDWWVTLVINVGVQNIVSETLGTDCTPYQTR